MMDSTQSTEDQKTFRYIDDRDMFAIDVLGEKSKLGCEIGVLLGGWSIQTLLRLPCHLVGVDPYNWDQGEQVRETMLSSIREYGLSDRFTLLESLESAEGKKIDPFGFDFVHIDGEHTEKGALQDLRIASTHLKQDGVLIVDDWCHPMFPGVQSAVHMFMAESDFRIFAVSQRKAYLSRLSSFRTIQDKLVGALLEKAPFTWCWQHGRTPSGVDGQSIELQGYDATEVAAYEIPSLVRGSRIALLLG
jgi:predicted O-methyltransferase YrrM